MAFQLDMRSTTQSFLLLEDDGLEFQLSNGMLPRINNFCHSLERGTSVIGNLRVFRLDMRSTTQSFLLLEDDVLEFQLSNGMLPRINSFRHSLKRGTSVVGNLLRRHGLK